MTVQATCDGWISASGVSIYLLHHAVRDQRVGAGRADHNHDLGGGSIEDLGLVQAIGGAGRGIGGAGQFASWTRAAQLRTSTWAEAAVARATVPPRRSTLRWTCPGRALKGEL